MFVQNGQSSQNWLESVSGSHLTKRITFPAGFCTKTVSSAWSADSKRLLLIREPMETSEVMVVDVDSGKEIKLPWHGACVSAVISPDGKMVAATHQYIYTPNSDLLLWDVDSKSKTPWRIVGFPHNANFPHDVISASWLSNGELLVGTNYATDRPRVQGSFLIGRDGRVLRDLSKETMDADMGSLAPYADSTMRVLGQTKTTDGPNAESFIHIDPLTGAKKVFAVQTTKDGTSGWQVLWRNPRSAILWTYSGDMSHPEKVKTLMTRTVDCVHDTIGPIERWRSTIGEPSVDSAGQVAGWYGDKAGFLKKQK